MAGGIAMKNDVPAFALPLFVERGPKQPERQDPERPRGPVVVVQGQELRAESAHAAMKKLLDAVGGDPELEKFIYQRLIVAGILAAKRDA